MDSLSYSVQISEKKLDPITAAYTVVRAGNVSLTIDPRAAALIAQFGVGPFLYNLQNTLATMKDEIERDVERFRNDGTDSDDNQTGSNERPAGETNVDGSSGVVGAAPNDIQ